jgi:toxin ParE1/3/4
MAHRVVWSRHAFRDLEAIASYIAQDSPAYASIVVRSIVNQTKTLARFPRSGRRVPEFDDEDIRERGLYLMPATSYSPSPVWGGHSCPPGLIVGLVLILDLKNQNQNSGQECPLYTLRVQSFLRSRSSYFTPIAALVSIFSNTACARLSAVCTLSQIFSRPTTSSKSAR